MKSLKFVTIALCTMQMGVSIFCGAAATASGTTLQSGYTMYNDSTTGLQFAYPAGAKIETNPDKDTLVRFSGAIPHKSSFFMMTLSKPETADGTAPDALMSALESEVFPKLKNLASVIKDSRWIGSRSQFRAATRTITFDADGKRVVQRWMVFSDPQASNRLLMMTFLSPAATATDLEDLISRVTASADHPLVHGSLAAAERLRPFRFDGMSINHPADWHVQSRPDKDTVVKMTGKNMELTIGESPAELNLSIEQLQKLLEDEFLSKVKGYRKLSESNKSYGGGASGVKQTFYLESDGKPAFGQAFVFQHANKLYCMSVMTWGFEPAEAIKRFDSLASSLSVH
jgi:hypothetical protein